jgi:hypothetical protein
MLLYLSGAAAHSPGLADAAAFVESHSPGPKRNTSERGVSP